MIPQRPLRIVALGTYLPATVVTAAELDVKLGLPAGTVLHESNVLTRHFAAPGETAPQMAAIAARRALSNAGLAIGDIDLILGASGTPAQALPCGAALLSRELGPEAAGIAAFDIDSTCLSFMTALDVAASFLATGRYRRILVAGADIASVGLDWNSRESAMILGDAATAAVLDAEGPSGVLAAGHATWGDGAALTQIRGGGSTHHPRTTEGDYAETYGVFEMDGRAVFKQSAAVLPPFLDGVLAQAGLTLRDLKLVIPHQASPGALSLMRRRLGVNPDQWVTIAHRVGNTVATSIPLALDAAVADGRLQRGDLALLLGTAAGLSVGAMVIRF